MSDNKDFKEGLKATSLFGGVQLFNILFRIVRSKFVAILLGPEGMGVNGLLNSAILMINGLTGLGLGISAVKDISEAHASGDIMRIARTTKILRKLVWLTGVLGVLLCIALSPLLSKISFGSYDYITAFIAISITLLFMQLTAGQNVLMQGTRHFSYMAKASVWGSILGLLTSVPLYYILGFDGIVPAIIITALITLLLSWHFSRKIPFHEVKVTIKEAVMEGKPMAQMGFFISLQSLLALFVGYIIRIFISHFGGLTEVGLFVAGFTMVDTYVGMVFSAMGTEYYPRLASHSRDTAKEFNEVINHQIEIALILVSPLICIFLVFGDLAILILYSEKFLPITMMLCLAMMSNYFKGPAWCIAYSFLAKGDSKAFFINELLATSINTTIKLVFYYLWGLTGIGIGFLISYIVYDIQVSVICSKRYAFKNDRNNLKILLPQLFLGVLCLFVLLYSKSYILLKYSCGLILILCSFLLSYYELQKHVNLLLLIKNKISKQ